MSALSGVSLAVPPGVVVALLGANGAGKTTLLHCLAKIYVPDAGRVLLDGAPFDREDLAQRRPLGYLPAEPPLDAERTVLDPIGLVLAFYEVEEEPAVVGVLDALRRLSSQQRVTAAASATPRVASRDRSGYARHLLPS